MVAIYDGKNVRRCCSYTRGIPRNPDLNVADQSCCSIQSLDRLFRAWIYVPGTVALVAAAMGAAMAVRARL